MAYPTDPIEILGIWVAAISTIGFWSYALYGENIYFRWAEHTFVAASTGVFTITMFQTLRSSLVAPLLGGRYEFILLLILGLIVYLRLSPKTAWISRWPVALIVGVSAGWFLKGTLVGDILVSVKGTIQPIGGPLVTSGFNAFSNLVLIAAVVFTLTYFIFTKEHTGALGVASKIGRYFIMAMVGIYAGNIVMLRLSLLLGRITPVLQTFGLVPM